MPKKQEETYCSMCGMAITKFQVAAKTYEIELNDFIRREQIFPVQIIFCEECLDKFLTYRKGGLKAAKERVKKLQEMS